MFFLKFVIHLFYVFQNSRLVVATAPCVESNNCFGALVTGERTNTGTYLFLYEFVPLAAPPRKSFPKLAQVSLLAG